MSDVVAVTVKTVNLLVPGLRRGREYPGSADPDRIAEIFAAGTPQYGVYAPDAAERARLRELSVRLYRVFASMDDGRIDAACTDLNSLMADTGAVPTLVRHGDDPWHLHFHAADAEWAVGWVAGMATSLAIVLGSASADRLGVCSADRCDRVFADASRNGTRRFCSTACQNRMKAAAFRARRREDALNEA